MNTEQAVTLARYNAWANQRILRKAAHVPAATMVEDAPLSHHTLMGALVHILDAQWYWRQGAQTGNLPVETLSTADFPTFAALRRRWGEEDQYLLDCQPRTCKAASPIAGPVPALAAALSGISCIIFSTMPPSTAVKLANIWQR